MFHHTPHTTTQPHKNQPGITHNQQRPLPTVARPTEAELTPQHTERKPTPHHMERRPTLHHMERRPTPQLMVVKLTEGRPTPQPQPTEVKLMEVRPTVETLTLHHTERRPTPQPQITEVNNTVTRRGNQFDYFAKLFEDHQIPKKESNIENFVLLLICVFDIFNKLH